jgi:hypothetical protein
MKPKLAVQIIRSDAIGFANQLHAQQLLPKLITVQHHASSENIPLRKEICI